jgi:hypothetical protein
MHELKPEGLERTINNLPPLATANQNASRRFSTNFQGRSGRHSPGFAGQKELQMKRLTLILLFLTFLAPALAGQSQVTKTTNESVKTPSKAIPGQSARPAERKKMMDAKMMASCQEMMEQKQKMNEDMDAQDAQLTKQLAEMNSAPEHKKMDLMAAALTQMVEQRIAMDARKAKMEEEMMKHMMEHMQMGKESMSQCPMMKGMDAKAAGAPHDHQEEQK